MDNYSDSVDANMPKPKLTLWQQAQEQIRTLTKENSELREAISKDDYLKYRDVEQKLSEAIILLGATSCPACDGSGVIVETRIRDTGETDGMGWPIGVAEPEPSQCEWCYRVDALKQLDKETG
ncbi:hypothetical protein THIOSC13_420006 [uncultured Thiomicrorhabdus sp.]